MLASAARHDHRGRWAETYCPLPAGAYPLTQFCASLFLYHQEFIQLLVSENAVERTTRILAYRQHLAAHRPGVAQAQTLPTFAAIRGIDAIAVQDALLPLHG